MSRKIELDDEEAKIVIDALRTLAAAQQTRTTGQGTHRKTVALDLAARIRIA